MRKEDFADAPRKPWMARAVFTSVALLVLGGLGIVIWKLATDKPATRPRAQQIAILRQQPPPPPPKPPEKLPEPPKIEEEVKIDQPRPEPQPDQPKAPDTAAPDRPLGLDADGGAGADGFGLAANRGGRDITTIGGGSGGTGSTGRYFTSLIQRNFYEALARNRKAPQDEFNVVVRVWLADNGSVARTEVVNGSGNPQLDELIVATLAEMAPLREVPPPHLRQVQLRLNRRS